MAVSILMLSRVLGTKQENGTFRTTKPALSAGLPKVNV